MPAVLFITHAEVIIDPAVAVPDWPLSARGRVRHAMFAGTATAAGVTAVYCSAERKARDGALILAGARGLPATIIHGLHENDRSATGFLPPAAFEAMADRFFAEPSTSVRGWERAVDAQARIVGAIGAILAADRTAGDIAVVAHGGVGALLWCHLNGLPISRRHDQPGTGGGHWFAFDRTTGAPVHGWRALEAAG